MGEVVRFGPDVTSSIVGAWVYKKVPGVVGVFSPAPALERPRSLPRRRPEDPEVHAKASNRWFISGP